MAGDEQVKILIADALTAFANGQYEDTLRLGCEARKIEPNNPDAHRCVAHAYLGQEQYDEAIKSYLIASKYDPQNGNRYYELGYACTRADRLNEALKYLTKAEELKCSDACRASLHILLSVICMEMQQYDDALVNVYAAMEIKGIDMDLLKRKAGAYMAKGDYRRAVHAVNQIKLIAPTDYFGYQLAFNILLKAGKLDAALEELEKSKKYVKANPAYFFDKATWAITKHKEDESSTKYLEEALAELDAAVKMLRLSPKETLQFFVSAAELYLKLKKPQECIKCLDAAADPAASYNMGFRIIETPIAEVGGELSEYELAEMREAGIAQMLEKYGDYGLMEMAEYCDTDEEGMKDFSTVVESWGEEEITEPEKYVMDEAEEFEITQEYAEHIDYTYLDAYKELEDYDKVISYAQKLKGSKNVAVAHAARYIEVAAMYKRGDEDSVAKYKSLLQYFRNCCIKDPGDMVAVTFRVRCHIDVGEYDEAEKVATLLAPDARKGVMEMIEKGRQGGEQ